MAWLQSSFTSHQLLGDSSSSHKKVSKSSTSNKNSDPDKSDTPLLCDLQSPETENPSSGWLKSSSSTVEKKQNSVSNSSKTGFLPHGLFEKGLGTSKSKMQNNQNASNASGYDKKPAENMKLLPEEDNKKNPLFDDDDEDDNEDSDDDWCIPRLGGYQRVRPCAE